MSSIPIEKPCHFTDIFDKTSDLSEAHLFILPRIGSFGSGGNFLYAGGAHFVIAIV